MARKGETLSNETKAKKSAAMKTWHTRLAPEQKFVISAKQSAAMRKRIANLTPPIMG